MSITTLLCYANEDDRMVKQLKDHLSSLEKNKYITIWDCGNIVPGTEWQQTINTYLAQAQIILLLISSSFLASDFCYKVEVQCAIERHEQKQVRVIPIILRPVHWEVPPIDKLQPLPTNAKPISSHWKSRDEGFTNVVKGILEVVKQWQTQSLSGPTEGRRTFMKMFDELVEAIKVQIQPVARAHTIASTLQQLSVYVPNGVTLADLIVGWQKLAQLSMQEDDDATMQRRKTCGELAKVASQFTIDQGNLAQATETWRIWSEAFKNRDDRRQAAMAKTFTRELAELQKA